MAIHKILVKVFNGGDKNGTTSSSHPAVEIRRDLQKDTSLVYAEDVVISLCRELSIGPIARHLFGLYFYIHNADLQSGTNPWSPTNTLGVFVASNEKIAEWKHSQGSVAKFELRLRFKPRSLSKLREVDKKAFNYYFWQVRTDFFRIRTKDKDKSMNNKMYGLAVTDLLRECLESHIDIDSALETVDFKQFLPYQLSSTNLMFLKSEIRDKLHIGAKNAREDVDFVKQEYINTFLNEIYPDYGVESYDAIYNDHANNCSNKVLLELRPYAAQPLGPGLFFKAAEDSRNIWTKICSIPDLCFISIQCKITPSTSLSHPSSSSSSGGHKSIQPPPVKKSFTAEISRRNGIPAYCSFVDDLTLKSFVSLLDGYYRLQEKWSFNICKEVSSPSLAKLKSMKCHGPVGLDFAYRKLKEKSDRKPGTYLLRESMNCYDEYKIDVMVSSSGRITTYKIETNPESSCYYVNNYTKEYPTMTELAQHFCAYDEHRSQSIPLKTCLPPSEYDKSPNLLLAVAEDELDVSIYRRSNSIAGPFSGQYSDPWPKILPSETLKMTSTTWSSESGNFQVKLAAMNNYSVVLKMVKSDKLIPSFLKSVSAWIHLKSDCLVQSLGMSLSSPLALVMEYLPHGPLDAFLQVHKDHLKVVDLIEAASCASRALWYLNERGLVHGKIRCHNFLVSNYSENSLKVKLSDPISDPDDIHKYCSHTSRDNLLTPCSQRQCNPFLPPEYVLQQTSLSSSPSSSSSYPCASNDLANSMNGGLDNLSINSNHTDYNVLGSSSTETQKTNGTQLTLAGDVYAFGTSLWQIFSYGCRPTCETVLDLVQPIACPCEIWNLINECWQPDPDFRKQPQSIVRDVSQLMYEVYNSRRGSGNEYSNLVYDHAASSKQASRLTNKFERTKLGKLLTSKNRSGSQLSLNSVRSVNSSSTLLTGISTTYGEAGGRDFDEGETCSQAGDAPEPWFIEAHQLKPTGVVLGKGCYGEVIKAILTQWAGLKEEVVAVKRINQTIPSDAGLRDMRREFEIMKKLSHKNIVEIKGFVEEPHMMLVMEYVPLGSLVSYLTMWRVNRWPEANDVHARNSMIASSSTPTNGPTTSRSTTSPQSTSTKFPSLPLIDFALDIVNGMSYLESKSIVHRDLAARNILVASPTHVKISDFGLAQFIDKEDSYYRMKTQRGLPLRWYAPESLKYGRFSHKSDVWSFGVTLWEMYSYGENPIYPGDVADSELLETLERGVRLECPTECPLAIYQIMHMCWRADSHQRPSFSELKAHIEDARESKN